MGRCGLGATLATVASTEAGLMIVIGAIGWFVTGVALVSLAHKLLPSWRWVLTGFTVAALVVAL
jgi:hypothetical protein